MTTADGTVLGITVIVDNGPPRDRWNVVIMGDGYKVDELTKYHDDVTNFVRKLRSTIPFGELWNAINIYRIDVTSTDSGADNPTGCNGGTDALPSTYFDAAFCYQGIRRSLVVNSVTAKQVANDNLPAWDTILVLVNSPIYGGFGLEIAVCSTHPLASEIALHEIGHAAFGLADEYEYRFGCDSGERDQNRYNGPEPVQRNVTIDTNRTTIKWRHLIDPATPLPTTSNADCTICDPQPSPVPQGTVGAFEGAYKYHCGIYRPEFDCKMRNLEKPFCAVCEEVIIRGLSRHLFTTVPDVGGMDARQARQAIHHQQLAPRLHGDLTNSEAQTQDPEGGDVVRKGTAVHVWFVSRDLKTHYRKGRKKLK